MLSSVACRGTTPSPLPPVTEHMILGLGIDQCDVSRMRDQLADPTEDFINTVFLPAEITYCTSKHHPAEHFAARFAAKEAVLKALAGGDGQGTFWLDIEIAKEANGRPRIELAGRLGHIAEGLGVRALHVSLTHTSTLAAAVVVAEGRNRSAGGQDGANL